MTTHPKVVIQGADPTTTNMGVSALFATAVAGVHRRCPKASITVVDGLLGRRRVDVRVDGGDPIPITLVGARTGMRFYRPENFHTLGLLQRFGRLGSRLSPTLRAVSEADIVLDASGGDSFTDLYGPVRWIWVSSMKRIAIRCRVPLLMLPKTYGPFAENRSEAANLIRSSRACWSRDARSHAILEDLLGDRYDPSRHRRGVDMAFGLEPRRPGKLPPFLAEEQGPEAGSELIGLNVSGLVYNDPKVAFERYGFKAHYREIIERFVKWVLEATKARLLLVPHVMSRPPSHESDLQACESVCGEWRSRFPDRIDISSIGYDQNEIKWVISRCDWFCGTRMHATIAGLSTCTATSTVSYSDKALGVFESCGLGNEVFDPRTMDTESVVCAMIESYRRRDDSRRVLEARIPGVKATADRQMDDIVEVIRQCARERRGGDHG